MLFPGSRIWYEGTVADLAAVAEEIRASRFSGHAVLEFPDAPAVVVCSGGAVTLVFEKVDGRFQATGDARGVWERSRTGVGRLTVFELPPALAERFRAGIGERRPLCSGTAGAGCDPRHLLRELKGRGFSGMLDAESPAGKLLLDFEAGVITACHHTAAAGPALHGFAAFQRWHEAFVRAEAPTAFSVSAAAAPGNGHLWAEILMAGADDARLPLVGSTERLAGHLGRRAAPGELLFEAGGRPRAAFAVISGEVELVPGDASRATAGRRLGPGALVGLAWLDGAAPAPFAGRALEETRYLRFGRDDLPVVFENSPAFAARLVRAAAALLARTRTRLDAFRADPRLAEAEAALAAALARAAEAGLEGIQEAALLRELADGLALPQAEAEGMFRRLVALGSVSRGGAGRVALTLREV